MGALCFSLGRIARATCAFELFFRFGLFVFMILLEIQVFTETFFAFCLMALFMNFRQWGLEKYFIRADLRKHNKVVPRPRKHNILCPFGVIM